MPMTISQAIIIALLISVFVSATNANLATNTNMILILLIALIALAGVTTISNNQNQLNRAYYCRNRIISPLGTITQTLF